MSPVEAVEVIKEKIPLFGGSHQEQEDEEKTASTEHITDTFGFNVVEDIPLGSEFSTALVECLSDAVGDPHVKLDSVKGPYRDAHRAIEDEFSGVKFGQAKSVVFPTFAIAGEEAQPVKRAIVIKKATKNRVVVTTINSTSQETSLVRATINQIEVDHAGNKTQRQVRFHQGDIEGFSVKGEGNRYTRIPTADQGECRRFLKAIIEANHQPHIGINDEIGRRAIDRLVGIADPEDQSQVAHDTMNPTSLENAQPVGRLKALGVALSSLRGQYQAAREGAVIR